jgi:hypothetical protein
MIKVDWLAASASLRSGGAALVIFLCRWRLQIPPANGKHARVAEKIYQTPLGRIGKLMPFT